MRTLGPGGTLGWDMRTWDLSVHSPHREFLRAINHFAATLTETFLSDSSFELQVSSCCLCPAGTGWGPGPAHGAVGEGLGCPPWPLCSPAGHSPCVFTAALEQLFPPRRGFPHPGLTAAGELLPGQAQQHPGQVSRPPLGSASGPCSEPQAAATRGLRGGAEQRPPAGTAT